MANGEGVSKQYYLVVDAFRDVAADYRVILGLKAEQGYHRVEDITRKKG